MKKISFLGLLIALCATNADAAYDGKKFRDEIARGVDVRVTETVTNTVYEEAPGELGGEVYETKNAVSSDLSVYVPTTMYIRGGAGMTIGALSDKASAGTENFELKKSWVAHMGLGWNLSSYVRAEADLMIHQFGFEKNDDATASAQEFGGTLYFDFARRYVRSGDITKRRTVVPFMGIGMSAGMYEFENNGADGFFVAPRGVLGLNVMLNDLLGIDVYYQYQLFIGDGFGWDTKNSTASLSNVMVSFRMNF